MSAPSPSIAEGVDRRIRAAAAHAGISMEELADQIAKRPQFDGVIGLKIANLKNLGRKYQARIEQLEAIADVTGMPLWYLVAGVDGLDIAHEPRALDTVPAETLAEVRELRAELRDVLDHLRVQDA